MDPELIVLDVGHGTCVIIQDDATVAVVDAPRGGVHIDALKQRGITRVDAVIVSHADADHIGGVHHLLLDESIHVAKVYVNPDASKTMAGGGRVWSAFGVALADAERHGTTEVVVGVKRGDAIDLPSDAVRLETVAPTTELLLAAPGGQLDGRKLGSNSASLVIRVWFNDEPMALLTGDIDEIGLSVLLAESTDIRASLLVFPHHGGKSGGDDEAFAQALCSHAQPDDIVFSFGREVHDNPRAEIMRGALTASPEACVECTQLSRSCSANPLHPEHINDLPALGRALGQCCAGSLQFSASGLSAPAGESHRDFIDTWVPTPLCRRDLSDSK